MALVKVGETEYHVADNLYKHWERHSLKAVKKQNMDRVYPVTGREGTGKSTWAIQQAGVLDPDMFKTPETFVSRICFTPEDFFNLVRNVKNGVIIFDEAFRGFSSRTALSKVNKKLVQALMEMRQNNNIVFIVLPSFHYLDRYPAEERSNGLFNIYINKSSGKRAWKGYNRHDKNIIYRNRNKYGKKYQPNTFFKGYFYGKFPGGPEYEKAYLEKKSKSLQDMDQEEDGYETNSKFKLQRDLFAMVAFAYLKKHKIFKSQQEYVDKIREVSGGDVEFNRNILSEMKLALEKRGISLKL